MTRRKRARSRRARNAWWREYRRSYPMPMGCETPDDLARDRRFWTPERYARVWMSHRGPERRRNMRDAERVSRGAR